MSIFRRIVLKLRDWPLLILLHVLPRDSHKVVFGAWEGKQFSDNPKYFMLYLLKRGGYKCVWVGDEKLRAQVEAIEGARFARKGSVVALWHCLTAKFYVHNILWREDIIDFPHCRRVTIINLWHGIPLKCIGARQMMGNGVRAGDHAIEHKVPFWRKAISDVSVYMYDSTSWSSVSSQKMADIVMGGFPGIFKKDRMLMAGSPRNDFLINNKSNDSFRNSLREKYATLLGVSSTRRWYLYLPTFRHDGIPFSFKGSKREDQYQEVLRQQDAVLIEKQHFKVLKSLNLSDGVYGNICIIGQDKSTLIDVQELLLSADVLITDYSSCFLDFELLGRPVIHYAYDLENYVKRDSGLEYNIFDIAAGPVVCSEGDLLSALMMPKADLLSAKGKIADEPIIAEKGHACDSVFKAVMEK